MHLGQIMLTPAHFLTSLHPGSHKDFRLIISGTAYPLDKFHLQLANNAVQLCSCWFCVELAWRSAKPGPMKPVMTAMCMLCRCTAQMFTAGATIPFQQHPAPSSDRHHMHSSGVRATIPTEPPVPALQFAALAAHHPSRCHPHTSL